MENESLNLLIQHGDKITGFIVLIALVFFYAKGLLPLLKKIATQLDKLSDEIETLNSSVNRLENQSANTEKEFIRQNTYLEFKRKDKKQ